ncbi:MAG: flavoprotein [Planctomycetota bacterium]
MKSSKILLGVTGGISVYKVCDLIRVLKKDGHQVSVILSEGALKFIKPLVFQTLTENKTYWDLFSENNPFEIPIHIGLAEGNDIMVIVPATANTIAKIYSGIADSLLTSTVLAFTKDVLFVPAMNTNMYKNKITQRNINELKNIGYHFLEPEIGELACKIIGEGHLPDIDKIKNFIYKFL